MNVYEPNVIGGPACGCWMEPREEGHQATIPSKLRFLHAYVYTDDRWYHLGCVGKMSEEEAEALSGENDI